MPHEWELFEQDVKRLYVDGNWTMEATLNYLQETYGVNVTAKQFKRRFAGLKNLRADEWIAISRELRAREAQQHRVEIRTPDVFSINNSLSTEISVSHDRKNNGQVSAAHDACPVPSLVKNMPPFIEPRGTMDSMGLDISSASQSQELDAASNLEGYLRRMDEKLALLDIKSSDTGEDPRGQSEALISTRNERQDETENYRSSLRERINGLRQRINDLVSDQDPRSDQETLQLNQHLKALEYCLDVCNMPSSHETEEDGQVMVATIPDHFQVRRVFLAWSRSPIMGSMTDEELRKITLQHRNMTDRNGGAVSQRLPIIKGVSKEIITKTPNSAHSRVVITGGPARGPVAVNSCEDESDHSDPEDVHSSPASLWDDSQWGGSSATSGLPSETVRITMQKVADTVLDDSGLTRILEASAFRPDFQPETVLREFKCLLKCYHGDLVAASQIPEHKQVARLVQRSKGTIVNKARGLLGLVHSEMLFPGGRPKINQQQKNEMTNYLLQHTMNTFSKEDANISGGNTGENISDDEEILEGNLYPEVSAAIAFLKDGVSMQKFQAHMRKFVLDAVWNQDVLQSPRKLPPSLPNFVDNIWYRLRIAQPEQAIPQGKRRVRWICSCGLKLYDDFDERVGQKALDELERRLNANSAARHSQDESVSSMTNLFTQTLGWGARHLLLFWSYFRGRTLDQRTLPIHQKPSILVVGDPSLEPESKELLYLLHCKSTGEYGIKLDQDLIPENLNDQDLFKFLRTVYCRSRKESKWFTLRNTTNINLCKFFVDYSHHASVRKHGQECMQRRTDDCVCLPPRPLIGREYQCHPTPPDPMPLPPFEKNYLMHYFLNPGHLSPDQIWVYTQLPKRMDRPLQPERDNFLPGWGIYFEDGWNLRTIYFLISLATIIGSLIFGVCWSIFKLDVQGAFGITSYWMATVTVGLGFMALRSTDKL